MTSTLPTAAPSIASTSTAASGRPATPRRALWPLAGVLGGATSFAAAFIGLTGNYAEKNENKGLAILDDVNRGNYHIAFLLGLVSVASLLVASSGWRRWAEERAPRSIAARTVSQALAATAAINVIGYSLAGSMALYLPGGTDSGWLTPESMFVNWTYLDFGLLLGWWGGAVAAGCVTALSFGRNALLPKWMGVVSILLLLPPVGMAIGMALPGMPGFTMPLWLIVVSVGMVFSKKAQA
ncbi:hypothetical protein [Motilibacter aurantiacus]|uniref:hypothetical protein n=1 Tax=Motilibacter aurantiacus TaxID=2714955 RepID=UPI001409D6AB|nr:hypothetical protein [Motilibacter aurantiacus]NHC46314.1 hypothetical protein [Motilibacter aurantiacus]